VEQADVVPRAISEPRDPSRILELARNLSWEEPMHVARLLGDFLLFCCFIAFVVAVMFAAAILFG
jgi:hypothetical protein